MEFQRNLRDFVQEQSRAVGQLKTANPVVHSTRKRPFHMSEELAFEQLSWDCSAIHLHHGASLTLASLVDGLRDQLLSRSRFARDQNRALGGCDQIALPEDPLKRSALPDDATKRVGSFDLLLQILVF